MSEFTKCAEKLEASATAHRKNGDFKFADIAERGAKSARRLDALPH